MYDFAATPFIPNSLEAVDAALTFGIRKQLRLLGESVMAYDFDDILQSARLDWLETIRDGEWERIEKHIQQTPQGNLAQRRGKATWAYLRRIGEYAALNHVKRGWGASLVDVDDYENIRPAPATGRRLAPWMKDPLGEAFLAQRSKRGARGDAAATRDVKIIALVIEGYSDDGIAMELGCTLQSAKTWRRDVKARLRRIADAGGLDTPDHPAPAPGHTCARCGAPAHSWHHIVPRRAGGGDGAITPLCLDCHSEAENWYMRQERPGLTAGDWRTIFEEWLRYM